MVLRSGGSKGSEWIPEGLVAWLSYMLCTVFWFVRKINYVALRLILVSVTTELKTDTLGHPRCLVFTKWTSGPMLIASATTQMHMKAQLICFEAPQTLWSVSLTPQLPLGPGWCWEFTWTFFLFAWLLSFDQTSFPHSPPFPEHDSLVWRQNLSSFGHQGDRVFIFPLFIWLCWVAYGAFVVAGGI